jgi:hypothetical protein
MKWPSLWLGRERVKQPARGRPSKEEDNPLRDSDTYMAIIEEGEEIQAKKDVSWIGEERFGA